MSLYYFSGVLICAWGDCGACARTSDRVTYIFEAYAPSKIMDTLVAGNTFVAATIISTKSTFMDCPSLASLTNVICFTENLKDLVKNEYDHSKTKEKYQVDFKGGHVERDVLDELEIPYLNLKDFG